MGYTHYFNQQRDATQEEWDAITKDFETLLATGSLPPIWLEDDIPEAIQIDNLSIRFNGVGPDGHETMILSREGEGFNCCKTAAKPYDSAVTALLTLAHYHAPECWRISSDGGPDDWQEGVVIVNSLHPSATNPISKE